MGPSTVRLCSDCGETKPLEAFTRNKGTPWYHRRCKACRAARARAGKPPRVRKPQPPPGIRLCAGCGETKPLDDFTPTNGTRYRKKTCKPCRATAAREAYAPASKRARATDAERTCTDCGQTKELLAFMPIKRWPKYVYGRCRECRNRRARERYHSTPEIQAAEIGRAWKNKVARRADTDSRVTASVIETVAGFSPPGLS
jgi:hypothetical protein